MLPTKELNAQTAEYIKRFPLTGNRLEEIREYYFSLHPEDNIGPHELKAIIDQAIFAASLVEFIEGLEAHYPQPSLDPEKYWCHGFLEGQQKLLKEAKTFIKENQ